MKKLIVFLLTISMAIAFSFVPTALAQADTQLVSGVKAAYLTDGSGANTLYEYHATDRFPIASMVKIMTALLSFEEIERGNMTLDETLVISPQAMGMGGSQMFLNAGDSYPVSDLLKGVIVVSANDACVQLAERIAGSEEAFVGMMNERAAELGMTNTHFANCTGLPHPEGYSCAKDVSVMLRELIKYPAYHEYSRIWLEDYTHPDGRVTTMTNTNKLVRFYEGCNGGKTGYTAEAGFCLAASATRGGTDAISVVIGARDSKSRFAASTTLLNHAFAMIKSVKLATKGEELIEVPVGAGKERFVPATVSHDLTEVVLKGEQPKGVIEYHYDKVKAPLCAGDKVGEAYLVVGGVVKAQADLVATVDVDKSTWGDAIEEFLGYYPVKR